MPKSPWSEAKLCVRELVLLTLIGLVYFIYPIPHTIALRSTLLVLLLALCVSRSGGVPRLRGSVFWWPSLWLVALTAWIVLVIAFVSPFRAQATDLFMGDWLVALLVLFIGYRVASGREGMGRIVLTILTLSLIVHMGVLIAYQVYQYLLTGLFPLGATPFAAKDYHSTLMTTLFALLVGEVLVRKLQKGEVLFLTNRVLLSSLMICGIVALTLTSRNGLVVLLATLLAGGFVFFFNNRSGERTRLFCSAMVLCIFAGAFIWIGIKSDTRWEGFRESAEIAFDTEVHRAWLDTDNIPRPTSDSGRVVEESAYLRLAWLKVGLEEMAKHPWGLGYGHKAFGWALQLSYTPEAKHESSHWGFIDFALANGVPGLLLLIILFFVLARRGYSGFKQGSGNVGLLLFLSVLAYFVRIALDGHISGFRLEMFTFLIGVLVCEQLREVEVARKKSLLC